MTWCHGTLMCHDDLVPLSETTIKTDVSLILKIIILIVNGLVLLKERLSNGNIFNWHRHCIVCINY